MREQKQVGALRVWRYLKVSQAAVLSLLFLVLFQTQGMSQPEFGSKSLVVAIKGVFDSKLTVTPYENGRYASPIKEIPNVKDAAVFSIPQDKLPGQFLLRMDYRQNEGDQPYPSEFTFFMSDKDLSIEINPLQTTPDSINFGNDRENPTYFEFAMGDGAQRQQLALLEQLLLGYDSPNSSFYKQAVSEFEKRRKKYNQWVTSFQEKNKDLYVSHFFQFQKVPASNWDVAPDHRIAEQASHYFDEVDLNDVLILKTQAFDNFIANYMRLFGERATTLELRDELFTEAGRIACEKASQGHPTVYGWMVDYYYQGYESYDITAGIKMLEQHIQNPNCLTSKKQEIVRRLEGMQVLVEGSVAPAFDAEMSNGMKVHFAGISDDKDYGLLIFYDSTCGHCKELLRDLKTWYGKSENRVWFDVISIAVDDDRSQWRQYHTKENPLWTDIWTPGGINSQACKDYYILSSPVMFIVDKEQKILATPTSVEEINRFLNN